MMIGSGTPSRSKRIERIGFLLGLCWFSAAVFRFDLKSQRPAEDYAARIVGTWSRRRPPTVAAKLAVNAPSSSATKSQ